MTFVDPGDFSALQVVDETDMDNIRNDLNYLNERINPTGVLMPYTGIAAPAGWLLCDGAAVSRVTYAALYAVTGDAYGPGNGSTTFNLPNLQQRFPMGKAASGTGNSMGATAGSLHAVVVGHNHTQNSHDHPQDAHNHPQDSHGHPASQAVHSHAQAPQTAATTSSTIGLVATGTNQAAFTNAFSTANAQPSVTVSGVTATNQETTANNQATTATNISFGSSGTDANLPPFQVFTFIIKF